MPGRPRLVRLFLALCAALSGASGGACTAPNPGFMRDVAANVRDASSEPSGTDLGAGGSGAGGSTPGPGLDAEILADSAAPDAAPRPDATPDAVTDAAPDKTETTPDAVTDAAPDTTETALAAGLLAHWAFDQPPAAGSTSLADSFGNTATLRGPISWPADHPRGVNAGLSLAFNGGNCYVDLALAPSQRPTSTGAKSVALWFKGTDPGPDTRTLIALFNQSKVFDVGLQLGVGATKIQGWAFGRASRPLSSTTATPRNAWHHVVYTYGGGTHVLYVDGVESSRSTVWIAKDGVLDVVKLGTWDESSEPSYFQGLMSDVRIYDHPLGTTEIRSLAGLPP